MKHAIHILAAVLLASASYALDITTTKGVTYSNVTVKRVEPDGVSITHSTGITKIMFNELTPEDQERFHLSADKARAYNEQRRKSVSSQYETAKRNEEIERRRKWMMEHSKVYRLKCFRSDEDGILAHDKNYVWYYIQHYEAMPETWFEIRAVELFRKKLGSMQSAIELAPFEDD